ncbi:MAG: ABC transporter ATP-binding protein [Spirochaetales bacterium]|nr:ABC transporter ATP-binding protein [Spirochaetales bacterium]
MTIIHKDVDSMENVVGHLWTRMTSDFLTALILGAGLFTVNIKMGLIMISLLPIGLIILWVGLKKGKSIQKSVNDKLADMVSLFVEYVKGLPVLKTFSESRDFEDKLNKSTEDFGKNSKKAAGFSALLLGGYNLVIELGFALLACTGAFLAFRNELSIFHYLMFIIISREFFKPFMNMESHWLNYLKVKDSYNRIRSVTDAPPVPEADNPQKPSNFDIYFEHVEFGYEEDGFRLQDADFRIPQGSLTALVGPSGSGKTTLTNLLLRFWDPNEGSIKIGGIDTKEIAYDDLLGSISIVMQNVILFADTIYNNIRIGCRNASPEDIFAAAEKAMIHDFILNLPEGYQTVIGENGIGLSGGQKQRLSIARAFLNDAPIVILDEMTSNVDPINEVKIQKAVSRLAEDRTVIVIAHRLNTIRSADNILVLDEGKIVQSGRHSELMTEGGLYRSLVEKQDMAGRWRLPEAVPAG